MAAGDARPIPQRGVAYRVYTTILDADGDPVSGAAIDSGLASGANKAAVSKDGAALANSTNNVTETPASSGIYVLDLTLTEMTADAVVILFRTTTTGAKATPIILYPEDSGDIRATVSGTVAANVTQWNSSAVAAPLVAGQPLVSLDYGVGAGEINLSAGNLAGAVPSVTGAVGSVTGAVGSVTGNVGGNVSGSVGSVLGNVGGNVTGSVGSVVGAVGSVTGNVGGNVVGSVGSVSAIGNDAITSASLAASAGTEIAAAVAGHADVAAIKAKTDQLTFDGTDLNANVEQWNGTAVPAEHTAGYPIVTIKDGVGTGELQTDTGIVESRVISLAASATAQIETSCGIAVNNELNDPIPGSPAADSINERIKTLDDNYTPARAPKLDFLDVAITSRATALDVYSQVDQVFGNETLTEPTQGTPPTTPFIEEALKYLYFYLTNKVTNDGTFIRVYARDETTVLYKRPVSEVGGLFTRGEAISGP